MRLSDSRCKCGGSLGLVSNSGGTWHNSRGNTFTMVDGKLIFYGNGGGNG